MVKRLVISLVLIVLMVGAGATIARVMLLNPPRPPERDTTIPPPLVQTVRLVPETVTETIVGYGSARAYRSATLRAEVSGEVLEIGKGLQDGSPIAAGQLLVGIDQRQYAQILEQKTAFASTEEARLQQLEVEEANLGRLLEIADREVKLNHDEERRLAQLFEQDHASKREYDVARLAYNRSLRERTGYQNQLALIDPRRQQLQASYRSCLAEVELARLDVQRCRIVAPFDGQIDELMVEVGETVQRGDLIARVVDPLRVEVPVELPLSAHPRVKPGDAVELQTDTLRGVNWMGTIERLSPDADEQSRTFRAYVVVDNRAQETPLVAGYFLRGQVRGPTFVDVVLVPRGAIVEDHLFVVNNGLAHRRSVRIERFLGDQAVVTGQVQGGEAVIVTNLDLLTEGMTVRVGSASGGPQAGGAS